MYNEIFNTELEAIAKVFLENVPCTISIWDEDLNILSCSDQAIKMFGLSDKEEFRAGLFSRLSPEYQPCGTPSHEKGLQLVSTAFREGRVSCEWMHLTTDGETFLVELVLVRFVTNGATHVVGFATDLRSVMAAHEKEFEQKTAQRLQAILDAAPFGCCITDENGLVVDCNDAMVKLFDLKDKQEYKDRFSELSPEYQPSGTLSRIEMQQFLEKTFTEGSATFEWMHQTLDGTPIPVEVHLIHTILDGKSLKIGYLRDLREFHQHLAAEREANERQKLMIDTIPLLITYWDSNHEIKESNKYAAEFYGYESEEIGLERAHDDIIAGTEWYDRLDEIFANGSASFTYEDLQNHFWEVEGVRTTYNGEPVVVTYGKNVTRLRELQEEQRRREVAEESDRAKTMFIANMSHEIRTPMNSILGYSELALEKEMPEDIRGYIKQIVTSSHWLLDIINSVLDMSKIESGLIELEKLPFDIGELVETCQYLMLKSAEDKGVKLSFSVRVSALQGKTPLGDPTKISQVCMNILSNAVKFTDSGGVITASVVAEKLDEHRASLGFEFKDTGIGMTNDQLSRIFEPFIQADSSTTRKYGGTGLGLAIAKRLVGVMGGDLKVQSSLGEGSIFSFTINVDTIVAETKVYNNNSNVLLSKPIFEKGEILVVDDNDMNLHVACEHLRHVGLTPTTAMNGKEAVDKVKQRMERGEAPYDLIFMDIHMPEMDGKEAATIIAGLHVGTPIVAMTAETAMFIEDNTYSDSGMSSVLRKPFTTQEIWRCLLKYLQPVSNDTQHALEYSKLMEDKELLSELRVLFVAGNRDTIENITAYLEQGNVKDAHRLAHTLKNSALIIGKPRVSNIAKEVERLLKNNQVPNPELMKELTSELRLVLDELTS